MHAFSHKPLVERSFDASEINRIINMPVVFKMVALPGMEVIDLAPVISDPRNVLLMADGGGFLFAQDEPGIYEVHTNFLPGHRGRAVIDAAKAAATWMFTHTDAMILQTRVPLFNKAALRAITWCGFQFSFARPAAWPTNDGMADVNYYRLPYETWVETADLVDTGRLFHALLDAEFIRHGNPPHSHADDQSHDRFVGACFKTILAGQPEKAVNLYNRWARFSGYGQVGMTSRSPLILDIVDALLLIKDDSFKVIKCR